MRPGPNRRHFLPRPKIERICTDELKQLSLLPSAPAPIRIERFVERRFATPRYEELTDGVLGFTEFGPRGVSGIVISRSLAEARDRTSERRVASTLAHEAGHGLLHAHLFALGDAQATFDSDSVSDSQILCRDGATVRREYDGRWWEHQANLAMAALLVPEHLLAACLSPMMVPLGSLGAVHLPRKDRDAAAELVSETFDVSGLLASIRIGEVYPDQGAQLTL